MDLTSCSKTMTFIAPNKKIDKAMKTVKLFELAVLLLKGFTKAIGNKAKEKRGEFLSKLLLTLGTSLLGNLLSG